SPNVERIKAMRSRIGGIHSLERIAKDSQRDHGPIMEILAAYVRENTKKGRRERVAPEVQAILTVLGRRMVAFDQDPIDLRGANLRGANLSGANLTNADLRG